MGQDGQIMGLTRLAPSLSDLHNPLYNVLHYPVVGDLDVLDLLDLHNLHNPGHCLGPC